jgi:hypothetical protein
MAIVVEDGTGLSNAQAYASAADLQAYCAERALSLADYNEAAQEAALVISAKDWIDGYHEFVYNKLDEDQALDFPRDNDIGLPDEIVLANIKAAYLQLQGLLLVNLSGLSVAGTVESESKAVGSLSKSVKYKNGSAQVYGRILPADLTNLLRPYLSNSGLIGTVSRA